MFHFVFTGQQRWDSVGAYGQSLNVTPNVRGQPLQELLGGTGCKRHQEAFAQISEDHVGRAIRTMEWKYSVWASGLDDCPDSASDVYVEQCVYDLKCDPVERRNLVLEPSYKAIRARLAAILKRRIAEAGQNVPEIIPALESGRV